MFSYWMLIIVTLALGLGASGYVNSQLKKYSNVPSASGITGAQAAERMLRDNGVVGVQVNRGAEGQDHFDPRTNSISLSPSVYDHSTVTAYATACHEVGHACQYAQQYTPLKLRTAFWPVANAASSIWFIVFMIGLFMGATAIGGVMIDVAIVMYVAVVLFQLITLPVEFNASSRALSYMKSIGLPQSEVAGSTSVLRACALTYVAAALASLLQLVYLLGMRRD
jgi:hypothetical protein